MVRVRDKVRVTVRVRVRVRHPMPDFRYGGPESYKGTAAQGRYPPLFLVLLMCRYSLSFLRYKEVNKKKYKF